MVQKSGVRSDGRKITKDYGRKVTIQRTADDDLTNERFDDDATVYYLSDDAKTRMNKERNTK